MPGIAAITRENSICNYVVHRRAQIRTSRRGTAICNYAAQSRHRGPFRSREKTLTAIMARQYTISRVNGLYNYVVRTASKKRRFREYALDDYASELDQQLCRAFAAPRTVPFARKDAHCNYGASTYTI
jgi:hypothetical protein